MLVSTSFKKQLFLKEIAFYQLLKNNSNFDSILFPEKIENGYGSFPLLKEGNLIDKDKRYFLAAMEAIAKFHHFSKKVSFTFLSKITNYYVSCLQTTMQYAKDNAVDLPDKQLAELEHSLTLINDNSSVIHDDFLPQNVLVDGSEIKIIDWADMRYGFTEHDVGRFLGDINENNPNWQKKYYPNDWCTELEEKYLSTRKQLDQKYNIENGKELIRLGKMWNYLGPIEMCLKRGDKESIWFKENLNALQNT